MPGGDGTGPRGFGPGTGRKAGYCYGYSMPGYANFIPAYRGWRGFGYPQPNEKMFLEQQAEFLKGQLRLVEVRLGDFSGREDAR